MAPSPSDPSGPPAAAGRETDSSPDDAVAVAPPLVVPSSTSATASISATSARTAVASSSVPGPASPDPTVPYSDVVLASARPPSAGWSGSAAPSAAR